MRHKAQAAKNFIEREKTQREENRGFGVTETAGNDIDLFAALFCTNLTYTISAVISNYSNSDILDGTVSVMTISYFCGLGESCHDIQCTP